MRWLALFLALLALILLPLLFFEDTIARISAQAVNAAREQPLLVATLIIVALALDVFLPVPNGVTNTLAGAIFGISIGGLIIWLGLMAASLLGYAVGAYAARPLAKRLLGEADIDRAERFGQRFGVMALIVTRPVPVMAEVATMSAGIAAMPIRLFLTITALSNLGVALLYAAIGAAAIQTQSPWLAVAGAVALPLAAWLAYQLFEKLRDDKSK